MTRPYAEVIGDPIAQSKSPVIHNFWLKKLGIDAEYRACHVKPEELADYFVKRRSDPAWRGCNVTIPHKIDATRYADNIEGNAATVGATNCVVPIGDRLVALNTDVDGVFAAVPNNDSPICLIGAGGAARAVMPVLNFWVNAWDLRVVVRDVSKAAGSLDPGNRYQISYHSFEDASRALKSARGVINASPLGMMGQGQMPDNLIKALGQTDPDAWVFDMVYAPLETELLKEARLQGRQAIDGLVMLVGQARTAFEKFFGVRPPDEHDAELRALLTA